MGTLNITHNSVLRASSDLQITQDGLASYQPKDLVESMLVTQLALTHNLIIGFIQTGKSAFLGNEGDQKMAARLMNVFNGQVQALKRYKKYGGPNISFNQVNASQAIVGNVEAGG
ncbi:MAG: hypothetical protein IKO41_11345 [Lachnospiraceae bacterium]|nr:hypothetical protein [Lachnospiraceae bacterium]